MWTKRKAKTDAAFEIREGYEQLLQETLDELRPLRVARAVTTTDRGRTRARGGAGAIALAAFRVRSGMSNPRVAAAH